MEIVLAAVALFPSKGLFISGKVYDGVFKSLGSGNVPIFIFLGVALILDFFLSRTQYGRKLCYIGNNMAYYNITETEKRIKAVRDILHKESLDAALVYFDELNVANGWYLTGWCGQFEKGAVLIPVEGEPILLGGPESEPFAKMGSAVTKVRCFPVFMRPAHFAPMSRSLRPMFMRCTSLCFWAGILCRKNCSGRIRQKTNWATSTISWMSWTGI